jgi:hypothetical protein
MKNYWLELDREWDVDGPLYIGRVVWSSDRGTTLHVEKQVIFPTPSDLAVWVEEAVDAWC